MASFEGRPDVPDPENTPDPDLFLLDWLFDERDRQQFELATLQTATELRLKSYGIWNKAYESLRDADKKLIEGTDTTLVVRRGQTWYGTSFQGVTIPTTSLCFMQSRHSPENIPRNLRLPYVPVAIRPPSPDGALSITNLRFDTDMAEYIESEIQALEELRDLGRLPNLDFSCTFIAGALREAA